MPADPAVTPELVAKHGLSPEEFERIKKILGRDPNFTELGIFSTTKVLPESTKETDLLKLISELNVDACWHGILVQAAGANQLRLVTHSRSKAIIIPARSSLSRARPPAWVESFAISSRWVRGRSFC